MTQQRTGLPLAALCEKLDEFLGRSSSSGDDHDDAAEEGRDGGGGDGGVDGDGTTDR